MNRTSGRIAWWSLLVISLWRANPAAALAVQDPVHSNTWKSHVGEDAGWAAPGFDDSAWTNVPMPASWEDQGYLGLDTTIWYRGWMTVGSTSPGGGKATLGLLIGPGRFGSYRVYLGGHEAGRYGFASREIPVPAPRLFPIPPEAIDSTGSVLVAIAFRRSALSELAMAGAGPAGTEIVVGDLQTLAGRIALEHDADLLAEVPSLIFVFGFLAVALYWLQLYTRRWRESSYLYFALLSLAYGLNTLTVSNWAFAITGRFGLINRVTDITGHLIAAAVIQFLWPFLDRKIGPLLRIYQLFHVACAAVFTLAPLSLIIASRPLRWLLLIPLMVASAVVILQAVWRRHPEARPLAAGGLVLVMVEMTHLGPVFGLSWPPVPAAWGFTAVIASMGVSLSGRFQRTLRELGILRAAEGELEQALQEARRMDAMGRLAGDVAHDFNNILASIVGYTDLLLARNPEGTKDREYATGVSRASQRAMHLVRQILTFGRRVEGTRTAVFLPPLIEETVNLLRPSLPAGIDVALDVDPDCGPVHADSTQVHQVLMNLATNGCHAMQDGGGMLSIGLRALHVTAAPDAQNTGLKPGAYACLTVRDTGTGMNESVKARIFEPFFTTKDAGRGTGLGLAVVHGIVFSHGGTITVDTEPGLGTTFCVYIPLQAEAADAVPDPSPPAVRGGNEKVLVVDDEADIADLSSSLLQKLGYRVTAITDSEEALGLFRAHPSEFDIVITNQTMPKMCGDELARHINDISPGTPIILHTGYAQKFGDQDGDRFGIRAHLQKPNSIRTIGRVVRQVLDDDAVR